MALQDPSNQALNSCHSFRPYKKLLENRKIGGFRELFMPENDFKTCYAVSFLKNIQILEAWKATKNMKFRLEFFFTCPSTYELDII